MKSLLLRPFGVIFWLHLIFIVAAITSPLWLDWKMVLVGFVLLNIQWLVIGGCFLSFLETGWGKDNSFWHHYLSRIWPRLDKRMVKTITQFVLPPAVIIVAYLIQAKFSWQPLLQI